MGGEIIKCQAWVDYHEGLKEGEQKGKALGRQEGINSLIAELLKDGKLSEEEAAAYLEKTGPSSKLN